MIHPLSTFFYILTSYPFFPIPLKHRSCETQDHAVHSSFIFCTTLLYHQQHTSSYFPPRVPSLLLPSFCYTPALLCPLLPICGNICAQLMQQWRNEDITCGWRKFRWCKGQCVSNWASMIVRFSWNLVYWGKGRTISGERVSRYICL